MIDKIDKLNRGLIAFLQITYINFLWLILTFCGAIILTIGPVTFASVSVIRQLIREGEVTNFHRTFFAYFKQGYKESLILSWLYLLVSWILYVDLAVVTNWYLRVFLLCIGSMVLISFIYIFPLIAHYDWPDKSIFFKLKFSFLFGLGQLQYTLCLVAILLATYWTVAKWLPSIFTFFGVGFSLFAITWTANQVFTRIELETAKER